MKLIRFFNFVIHHPRIGGERWSKPHVATLSLHSLFELRNCLTKKTVLLDAEATTMETIANLIVDQPQNASLTREQKDKVRKAQCFFEDLDITEENVLIENSLGWNESKFLAFQIPPLGTR